MVLAGIFAAIGNVATAVISFLGYPGIVLLMALESTAAPVPSELVMPFAGFLVAQGRFDFWLVVLAGTAGSLLGSLLSYGMGYYGGRPLVEKYGKWVLLSRHDLTWTERWFRKRGEVTIFVSRFVPVVRHLISIPAGAAKMNVWRFGTYTAAGAFGWMLILTYAGFKLGEHWQQVHDATRNISYAVVILLILVGGYVAWRHVKRK